jgi:lantibiotic modifying enzyme
MCDHDDHHAPSSPSRRDALRAGLSAAALGGLGLLHPRSLLAREVASAPRAWQAGEGVDAAIRAGRWIARAGVPSAHGITWPADPNDLKTVGLDLYNGSPGVVLFLLELHAATGEQEWLDLALKGADHLAGSIPATFDPKTTSGGLYTGVAGIAFTLEEAARLSGKATYKTAARRALSLLASGARPAGAGVEWSPSTDIISGNAGIGLYLLGARRVHGDQRAMDLAVQAAKRVLELGTPEKGGLKWAISPTMQRTYPNFSHGAAGTSYFLATMFEETGEQAFLDGALEGAEYLKAIATPTPGSGRMVFHSEPGNEGIFYLSWCHGPAGTARLFHRLASVSGEPAWGTWMKELGEATFAARIPEQRTPGFWNNVGQCCGNSGVQEYALAMHRRTREARWLELARRCAADTMRRATADGDGLKWVQAEHRVQPQLLVAQTGLMQGAAGVGLAMLHLDAAERGKPRVIVLPDDPWG